MSKEQDCYDILSLLEEFSSGRFIWPRTKKKWRLKVLKAIERFISKSNVEDILDKSQNDFVRIVIAESLDLAVHLHFYFPVVDRAATDFLHLFHHHGDQDMMSFHLCGGRYGYAVLDENTHDGNQPDIVSHSVEPGKIASIKAGQYHSIFVPRAAFVTLVFWRRHDGLSVKGDRKHILMEQNDVLEVPAISLQKVNYIVNKSIIEEFISSFCRRISKANSILDCETGLLEAYSEYPVELKTCAHSYPWSEMSAHNLGQNQTQ